VRQLPVWDSYHFLEYQRFEQYVYWFLGELVFKDHCNCLDNHKDYVLNDIVKPKSNVHHHIPLTCYLHVWGHPLLASLLMKAKPQERWIIVLSSPRPMQKWFAGLSTMDSLVSIKMKLKTTRSSRELLPILTGMMNLCPLRGRNRETSKRRRPRRGSLPKMM
jgi:hypothetical protein